MSPHLHSPISGIVQPRNKLDQGGLGRPGAPKNTHSLACFDVQVHPGQGIFSGVGTILKGNLLKVYTAVGHLPNRLRRVGQGRVLIQHLRDTVGAGQRAGKQQKYI